jgi:hypothetical protein
MVRFKRSTNDVLKNREFRDLRRVSYARHGALCTTRLFDATILPFSKRLVTSTCTHAERIFLLRLLARVGMAVRLDQERSGCEIEPRLQLVQMRLHVAKPACSIRVR